MKSFVLSGAPYLVLSGASASCYQAQRLPANPRPSTIPVFRNLSNEEFFEFLSNLRPSAHPVDDCRKAGVLQ